MNHFLLTIGFVIIVAAAVAIAAPFVVDWSSQRDFFESQASRLLGQPVSIEGPIDVRLLPEPRLRFADITIGDADAGREGVINIGGLKVTIAPGSILKAEIEITAAEIEAPSFAVKIGADGALEIPAIFRDPAFDPVSVSAATVQIRNGRISVVDAKLGREWTVAVLSGDASVRSLDGPYRFDGGFILDGARYGVRLATGKVSGDALQIDVSVDSTARPLAIKLDGIARIADNRPSYQGRLRIRHGHITDDGTEIGPIWRIDGQLSGDPGRLAVDDGSIVFGPAEREIKLAGSGQLPLRETGAITARVSGRQVDLDRFLGATPENPARPHQAIGSILDVAERITGETGLGRDIDLLADISAVILGGEILQSVSVQAGLAAGAVALNQFSIVLPGNAKVNFDGRAHGFGNAPVLKGTAALEARNVVPALRWMFFDGGGELREAEQAIAGLSVTGEVEIGTDLLNIPRIEGRLREAPFTGSFSYQAGNADRPGAVTGKLSARVIDIPAVDMAPIAATIHGRPDKDAQSGVWSWFDNNILDLDIAVDNFFSGDTAVSGLVANFTATAGTLDIREFQLGQILGLEVNASGSIAGWPTRPEGRIAIEARSSDLSAIAPILAERGWLDSASLGTDGPGLAIFEPATISADIGAGLTEDGSRIGLTATGSLAKTRIAIEGDYETLRDVELSRYLALDIDLKNESSRALLEQLGVEALKIAGPNTTSVPGKVSTLLRGVPSDALETVVDASLLGIDLGMTGTTSLDAGSKLEIALDGEARFDAIDAVLDYVGLPGVPEPKAGLLRGQISGHPRAPKFDDISGQIGGAGIAGNLALNGPADRREVSGNLSLAEADLGWLLGAGLQAGLTEGAADGAFTSRWSGAPLFQSPFAKLDVDVKTRVERLAVSERLTLADADFRVRLNDGNLAVDGLSARAFGAPVKAVLDVRPQPGGFGVSGAVEVNSVDLPSVSGLVMDAPLADGRLTLNVQADGQGRSVRAIVSSLSGEGRYQISDARIRALNPNAFPLVVRAAEAGMSLDDAEVRRVFARHLDAGPLSVRSADGAIALAGGVARISNAIIDGERARVRASGNLDLAEMALGGSLSLTPSGESAIARAQTEVAVGLSGALGNVARTIDVSALTGYLSVRQFEREVERIEVLQADILEHQRLSRELVLSRQQIARAEAGTEVAPSRSPPVAVPTPEQDSRPRGGNARNVPGRLAPDVAGTRQGGDFSRRIRSALEAPSPTNDAGDVIGVPVPPPVDIRPLGPIGQ